MAEDVIIEDKSKTASKAKELFKVLKIHMGRNYNAIDIEVNDDTYQVSVEQSVELDKKLIGKSIELKHKKMKDSYIFELIDYKI